MSIMFPNISPTAITIMSFDIRWYSLAYIMSAVLGFYYLKFMNRKANLIESNVAKQFFDDSLFYIMLGVLLGGRIGYTLFYGLSYYITNPLEVFFIWEGGMSFHGGMIGVAIAMYLLSKKYHKPLLLITDLIALATPIGLFFGRLANFVNAELYGHPTNVPWGVSFPNVYLPRHPSQIYEALCEGLVLGIILLILWQKKQYLKQGLITGIFLFGYSSSRFIVEFFRQGEIYFFNAMSMGQLLCIPMIILGAILIIRAFKNNAAKIN